MFKTKKKDQQQVNTLLEEMEQLRKSYEIKEEEDRDWFLNIRNELQAAISQHEKVNSQHSLLEEVISQIENRFSNVYEISEQSAQKSSNLYEKGMSLKNFSKKKVERSQQNAEDVKNTAQIIQELGKEIESSEENMSHLSERSVEIQSIVDVIEDIASQTNLLALNASIEAARAGESGKGFAVVAQEVRKLAESTADSTANIQALTNALQEEIENALQATKKSSGLIEKGIQMSEKAAQNIEEMMDVIQDSQLDIGAMEKMIEEQKQLTDSVKEELDQARTLFTSAHETILEHIEDAKIVDERLENGIHQLKH
ncbi:methyl-accepting chemotaxis protein [Bacillus sp. J14TS2]|uniref:methyl-accepting chemotaxis protein n=1 Tax=Bacillus sp. J14TS2 TaxID=2807188 RepID=UPI001B1D8012|nr:methyl-accepting chemotaxis protein [Bacillus sp. J14TS2]GIN74629.1 methyl-accepting chemotaxis protein [Bacillus sp. J14TS2]